MHYPKKYRTYRSIPYFMLYFFNSPRWPRIILMYKEREGERDGPTYKHSLYFVLNQTF